MNNCPKGYVSIRSTRDPSKRICRRQTSSFSENQKKRKKCPNGMELVKGVCQTKDPRGRISKKQYKREAEEIERKRRSNPILRMMGYR